MQTISLSASRRRSQVVILTGLALGAQSSTHALGRMRRALAAMRRVVTLRAVAAATFSAEVTIAVALVCAAAMWWHTASIADAVASQRAVALDAIMVTPWAAVWVFRLMSTNPEKGGER